MHLTASLCICVFLRVHTGVYCGINSLCIGVCTRVSRCVHECSTARLIESQNMCVLLIWSLGVGYVHLSVHLARARLSECVFLHIAVGIQCMSCAHE